MAHPNGNRRLVTVLALLAVLAVLVMTFKLGKMSGGTGRTLKSASGKSAVRWLTFPHIVHAFSCNILMPFFLAYCWRANRYSELVSSRFPLPRFLDARGVRPHHCPWYVPHSFAVSHSFPSTSAEHNRTDTRFCLRMVNAAAHISYRVSNPISLLLGSNDLERSQVVGKDGHSVTNNHRTSFGTFMTKYMSDPVVMSLEGAS